jgi:hypothetical protein
MINVTINAGSPVPPSESVRTMGIDRPGLQGNPIPEILVRTGLAGMGHMFMSGMQTSPLPGHGLQRQCELGQLQQVLLAISSLHQRLR